MSHGDCGFVSIHQATTNSLSLITASCGGIVFDEFQVHGEGIQGHVLFSDGEMALPKVRVGEEGGRIDAVHWKGRWWSEGQQPPVVWRQGYQSRGASGVFALELSLIHI